MAKCSKCKNNDAVHAMQYLEPDIPSFYALGSHIRGFKTVKVCDLCKTKELVKIKIDCFEGTDSEKEYLRFWLTSDSKHMTDELRKIEAFENQLTFAKKQLKKHKNNTDPKNNYLSSTHSDNPKVIERQIALLEYAIAIKTEYNI